MAAVPVVIIIFIYFSLLAMLSKLFSEKNIIQRLGNVEEGAPETPDKPGPLVYYW